jgi:hypothetical protein
MFTQTQNRSHSKLMPALLAGALLLAACAGNLSGNHQPTVRQKPAAMDSSATDAGSLATGTLLETTAVLPAMRPGWEVRVIPA